MKRIKRTLLLVAISCSILSINGQTKAKEWAFGAKAGITFYDNYGTTQGFVIGAKAEYGLTDNFFLRSGLEFIKTGASIYKDYDVTVSTNPEVVNQIRFSEDRVTNFLQVPLTIGYRLPISKNVNITLDAGTYFGVGLYSPYTFDDSESIYTDETTQLTQWIDKNKPGNIDLGFQGGIGVEYKQASIYFNYQGGLLNQSVEKNERINDKLKNETYSISLGYTF